MKSLYTILFFLSGIISFGQTQTDGVNDKEIERILRNYRNHNIMEFSLTSKTSWNNQKLWKETFRFVFENDSIFQTHWANDMSRYLITQNDVSYIYSKIDSNKASNYFNLVLMDSNGTKTSYRYLIQHNDTVLINRRSFAEEKSTGNTIAINYSYYDDEIKSFKYETIFSGDTVFEVWSTLLNGEWLIDSELKTISDVILKPEVEIIMTTTTGRNYYRTPNLKPVNEFKSVEINTIYYSNSGLIKYIEIKEINYHGNDLQENTEIIIPIIKESAISINLLKLKTLLFQH